MNVRKQDIFSKKVNNNQQPAINIKQMSLVEDKIYTIFAHLFKVLLIMELERLRKTHEDLWNMPYKRWKNNQNAIKWEKK